MVVEPSAQATVRMLHGTSSAMAGPVAEANCARSPECEWRGRAIYRLIDFESGPVADGESAVANGDMTPSYYPY